MPMRLDDGWNQVQFNLADFTKRAYGEREPGGGRCWWTTLREGGLAGAQAGPGAVHLHHYSIVAPGPAQLSQNLRPLAQVGALAPSPLALPPPACAPPRAPPPAGTNYVETLRVQIHANCRIRRIYFSDRLYAEEDLPAEFKLFLVGARGRGRPWPAVPQGVPAGCPACCALEGCAGACQGEVAKTTCLVCGRWLARCPPFLGLTHSARHPCLLCSPSRRTPNWHRGRSYGTDGGASDQGN